jgi:hypothetical protein
MLKVLLTSHPTIGSIGMTQPEAEEKFGKDDLKIYNTSVGLVQKYAFGCANAHVLPVLFI